MGLSHEHVGPKILAKIKIYDLTRAELLCSLCYEIPSIKDVIFIVIYELEKKMLLVFSNFGNLVF